LQAFQPVSLSAFQLLVLSCANSCRTIGQVAVGQYLCNALSLPQGTKEIAIICDDPNAPTQKPFVHWVAYKIPADSKGLAEGRTEGALEGVNDFSEVGYDGCMPPRGHGVHHYHFKVYALDTELDAPAGLSKDELLGAIEGHVLDEGELVGTYER
jgi:Raf kinase inhibitor-like YbhB/YbcL family protein